MNRLESIELNDLKEYGDKALELLYRTYKEEFYKFGKQFLSHDEDISDIYQDSVIILYEKVSSGKLTELTCTVKTYLFSIGKHLMINRYKYIQRTKFEPFEEVDLAGSVDIYPRKITPQAERLKSVILKLEESCQKILKLFYYRNFDMESIAAELNYKNANVVKSHKARCMQRLRKLFLKGE